MKILITGVKWEWDGMIGSRLFELLSEKHDVTSFNGDIIDPYNWLEHMDIKYDFVIHLAALAGVRTSFEDPERYEDTNVNGSKECFKYCDITNTPCLYASSSNSYEWWLNPYASTKKTVEHMASMCSFKSIGMRFHTVWPGRQDMLFRKIENNEVSYINANHSRDFIHVDDLCSGIETILNNFDIIYVDRNVVDIGTGVAVKTIDVYNKYSKTKTAEIRYDIAKGERVHTEANAQYLYKLGWKPKYNII
jgi:nucleoside-diphosphate-sugar epimerase